MFSASAVVFALTSS